MMTSPGLARTVPAAALAIVVAIVYPLVGLWRYRRLERLPDPLPSGLRMKFYRNVIVSQWTLVALAAWLMASGGRDFADLGESLGRNAQLTWIVSAILVATFALLSTLTLRHLARAKGDELPGHARRAGRILPRTPGERAAFLGVALTAGICEEILYRGYLPWWFAGVFGNWWVAFALAIAAFGLGHAYQGRSGVIVTAILGVFLSSVVLYTQSLIPGQVLHVAIDLVNGIALGATMVRLDAAAPVQQTEAAGGVAAPNIEPPPPAI